ncbi:unnamed protein product [Scytosiphon promiscuus]
MAAALDADLRLQSLDLLCKVVTPAMWVTFVLERQQAFEADNKLFPPLHFVALHGHTAVARALLDAGAKRSLRYGEEQVSPLDVAAHQGHVEVLRLMLEHAGGTDVNAAGATGYSPIHFAASAGKGEAVKLLLRHGADRHLLEGKGYSPVCFAAMNNHLAAMQVLLRGCGPEHLNRRYGSRDMSLLDLVAGAGHVDILRAIVGFGGGGVVDIHSSSPDGRTALHTAALGKKPDAIDVLVAAGARVHTRDQNCATPLHHASGSVGREVAAALLRHGADPNALNSHHQTPLHLAACQVGAPGTSEVVDLLLRSGADETVADFEGDTAADLVEYYVVEQEDVLDDEPVAVDEDVGRVGALLASAPADRAWRRRGFLVMCRAFPDRVQLTRQDGGGVSSTCGIGCSGCRACSRLRSGGAALVASRTRRRVKLAKLAQAEADWIDVANMLLTGWGEEALFRAIVGYL